MESSPELSELARSIRPGIYRHFKGGEYRVLTVECSEKTDEEIVRYESVGKPGEEHPPRTVEEFTEEVDKPELGYKGPRFVYQSKD